MGKIKSYTSQDPVFATLEQLAKVNPHEFELKRDELINEFIQQLPEKYKKRLGCFQWRINCVRDSAKTPLAACIKISKMMFGSVGQLNRQARLIQLKLAGEDVSFQAADNSTAKILDLSTYKK